MTITGYQKEFPATGSKGENSVPGILKKNFFKSQTLQDNTITRMHNTSLPTTVSGICKLIFET